MTGDEKFTYYDNLKCKESSLPISQINSKAEYKLHLGNALYLMGSDDRAELWASGWNH